MRRGTVGIAVLAIAAAAACNDDSTGVDPLESFSAPLLTGANEVPPVETDAEALAVFDWFGTSMGFAVQVQTDIDSVTAVHIHEGPAGENGGILVTLFSGPTQNTAAGESVTGSFTSVDDGVDLTMEELLDLMRSGDTYVNLHTEAHPSGEIRDQIEPDSPE